MPGWPCSRPTTSLPNERPGCRRCASWTPSPDDPAPARQESHHSISHGYCTRPKPVRCRSVFGLVRGTFTEPVWLVQVQLGPPWKPRVARGYAISTQCWGTCGVAVDSGSGCWILFHFVPWSSTVPARRPINPLPQWGRELLPVGPTGFCQGRPLVVTGRRRPGPARLHLAAAGSRAWLRGWGRRSGR